MSRRLSLGLLLAAPLALGGCYRITYHQAPAAWATSYDQWHHIGIFALVEFSDPVPLDRICPQGFGRVEHEVSFVNGIVNLLLNWVGFGWVYSPHTVRVYCAETGQGLDLRLDVNGDAVAMEGVGIDPALVGAAYREARPMNAPSTGSSTSSRAESGAR